MDSQSSPSSAVEAARDGTEVRPIPAAAQFDKLAAARLQSLARDYAAKWRAYVAASIETERWRQWMPLAEAMHDARSALADAVTELLLGDPEWWAPESDALNTAGDRAVETLVAFLASGEAA